MLTDTHRKLVNLLAQSAAADFEQGLEVVLAKGEITTKDKLDMKEFAVECFKAQLGIAD